MKKVWNIYILEYYSAVKNKDLLNVAYKWMEIENTILSEVSQSPKKWVLLFDSVFRYVALTSLECAFLCPCLPTGSATVAVSGAVIKHSNTKSA